MELDYNARDWFWIVGDDATRVYASARGASVPLDDPVYCDWLAAGGVPTRIASEAELIDVLRAANVPPYHLVPTRLIVDRLQAAGKLAAARAALDAADLYLRERWKSRLAIYADDAAARAMLAAIGADAAQILAPE
jgi:hypothetical protein